MITVLTTDTGPQRVTLIGLPGPAGAPGDAGAAQAAVSETAPVGVTDGALWNNPTTGTLSIYRAGQWHGLTLDGLAF